MTEAPIRAPEWMAARSLETAETGGRSVESFPGPE